MQIIIETSRNFGKQKIIDAINKSIKRIKYENKLESFNKGFKKNTLNAKVKDILTVNEYEKLTAFYDKLDSMYTDEILDILDKVKKEVGINGIFGDRTLDTSWTKEWLGEV